MKKNKKALKQNRKKGGEISENGKHEKTWNERKKERH